MPAAGMQLRQNMRQRGDTVWATHLYALRDCRDQDAVQRALAALRSRQSASSGGTVDGSLWRDAVHLFPKTKMVNSHNDACLQGMRQAGREIVTVNAVHAKLHHSGSVT